VRISFWANACSLWRNREPDLADPTSERTIGTQGSDARATQLQHLPLPRTMEVASLGKRHLFESLCCCTDQSMDARDFPGMAMALQATMNTTMQSSTHACIYQACTGRTRVAHVSPSQAPLRRHRRHHCRTAALMHWQARAVPGYPTGLDDLLATGMTWEV
jgi:hypothetical protein